MRIAVCAKPASGSPFSLSIDPATLRLDRASRPWVLGSTDRHAVEAALLVRSDPSDEIAVVAMAPSSATPAIREALAMGADRAVMVSDPGLGGSDLVGTSRVLAAALERIQPDITLFGAQAVESRGGLLWAALGERLGQPVLSQAIEIELSDGQVGIRRQSEFGYERLTAARPCLVSVAAASNQPRLIGIRSRIAAKTKPIEVLVLDDLGVVPTDVGSAGSRTRVISVSPVAERAAATLVQGEDAPAALVEYLSSKGLV